MYTYTYTSDRHRDFPSAYITAHIIASHRLASMTDSCVSLTEMQRRSGSACCTCCTNVERRTLATRKPLHRTLERSLPHQLLVRAPDRTEAETRAARATRENRTRWRCVVLCNSKHRVRRMSIFEK